MISESLAQYEKHWIDNTSSDERKYVYKSYSKELVDTMNEFKTKNNEVFTPEVTLQLYKQYKHLLPHLKIYEYQGRLQLMILPQVIGFRTEPYIQANNDLKLCNQK
jgi:hypothetical protein